MWGGQAVCKLFISLTLSPQTLHCPSLESGKARKDCGHILWHNGGRSPLDMSRSLSSDVLVRVSSDRHIDPCSIGSARVVLDHLPLRLEPAYRGPCYC